MNDSRTTTNTPKTLIDQTAMDVEGGRQRAAERQTRRQSSRTQSDRDQTHSGVQDALTMQLGVLGVLTAISVIAVTGALSGAFALGTATVVAFSAAVASIATGCFFVVHAQQGLIMDEIRAMASGEPLPGDQDGGALQQSIDAAARLPYTFAGINVVLGLITYIAA